MPERFAKLLRRHAEDLVRAWADDVYEDGGTDLASLLTFRELVEYVPDILEELAGLLDERGGRGEAGEAAGRLRHYFRTRFYQGALIDEVARELMLLRATLNDFLWGEAAGVFEGDTRRLRETLRRANTFFDELVAEAIVVYAVSLRPVVSTRGSVWPPPRRRRRGGAGPEREEGE